LEYTICFLSLLSDIEDLKADSANINNRIIVRLEKSKTYDSIGQSVFGKKYLTQGADIYYWVRIYSRSTYFSLTDGTLQQLKNAGGMRLIHKHQVIDSLLAYENNFKGISISQDIEMNLLAEYRDVVSKIFDALVCNQMLPDVIAEFNKKDLVTNYKSYMKKPSGNPQLIDNSAIRLNKLMNKLMYLHAISSLPISNFKNLKTKNENLIHIIQKEYHLK